jgi:hypothetical protein
MKPSKLLTRGYVSLGLNIDCEEIIVKDYENTFTIVVVGDKNNPKQLIRMSKEQFEKFKTTFV